MSCCKLATELYCQAHGEIKPVYLRPSGFGLGASDEQREALEHIRPPEQDDFDGFPDAPTLHRFRQVNQNRITDATDPDRVLTNTGQ